jgi:hypothetical protein
MSGACRRFRSQHSIVEGPYPPARRALSIRHRVSAIVQPLVFALMAFDRFLLLAGLVGVAGAPRALASLH